MQQCPKCGRTFENDTQKFCTHDGGRLEPAISSASSQAPTTYDLRSAEPFDPEATVTRLPDLNKTIAAAPTSEIRSKETGPATPPPPPPASPQTPSQQPLQPPTPPQRESQPTVAFNQAPPQTPPVPPQYYQPQPGGPPPPQQPYQQQPHQQPTPPQLQPQYAPAPPQQQMPQQQPVQKAPAVAGKKSSKVPLIIGVVVLLLVGGAAAWYFLIYKKGKAESNGNTSVANANTNTNANANANSSANTNANTNTTANANTSATPTPQPPPPNSAEFVNSKENLDGKLAEKYADFSFYYPNNWERDPKSGVAGANNFVQVERRLPPDFQQESFAVSWYDSKGTFETDSNGLFQEAVDLAKARLSKSLPDFKVLSDGETTINGVKGYEFRFQGLAKGTEKGDVTFWGRVVFLPPGKEGETHGVQLLMLTTSLAPELKSAEDVGVKGELPLILNSFKVGKS